MPTSSKISPDLRRDRLRFALVFAVVGGVLLTIYSFPYAEHGFREDWFSWYLSGYARVVGALLHVTDPTLRVSGTVLVGRIPLTIAKNCDAMDVNLLFVAAVVAFPARRAQRLLGLIVGSILIAVVNVGRIASLYFVGVYWPAAFEFVHAEAWPLLMVAFASGLFLLWCRWANPIASVVHAT